MKKIFGMIAAIIAIAAILIAAVALQLGIFGNVDLTINTEPYAKVIIEGATTGEYIEKDTGSLGRIIVGLNGGTYSIEITKEGYLPFSTQLFLTNPIYIFTFPLSEEEEDQKYYSLQVKTTPNSCMVQLVGISLKNSGSDGAYWESLLPKMYEIIVTKSGYVSRTLSFSLDSDTYKHVTLEERSTDPDTFILNVYVRHDGGLVSGAIVECDDKTIITDTSGKAVFIGILAGIYEVNAKKTGLGIGSKTVDLYADSSITITLTDDGDNGDNGDNGDDEVEWVNVIIAVVVFAVFAVVAGMAPVPGGIYGRLIIVVLGAVLAVLIYFFM